MENDFYCYFEKVFELLDFELCNFLSLKLDLGNYSFQSMNLRKFLILGNYELCCWKGDIYNILRRAYVHEERETLVLYRF